LMAQCDQRNSVESSRENNFMVNAARRPKAPAQGP
jgi:hypothetical protein